VSDAASDVIDDSVHLTKQSQENQDTTQNRPKKGKACPLPRCTVTLHTKQKGGPKKKQNFVPAAKLIWKESNDDEEEDDKYSDDQEEFGGSNTDGSNLEDSNVQAAKRGK
jgi:hypothetical protein